ncbi:LapA family protein [Nocardioides daejeonensis]|uniref:LapA family protein n=1 Tax=Nocardioides daejeonensis TaxID=1046556 RepID=UPI000D741ECE|nr:LapA family protein [Nocardioides daejeonensis]
MSEPTSTSPVSPRMIGAAVLGVLALVFVFQNHERGRIDFLFWSISMPAWIWLLVIFAAGVIVGLLVPKIRARGRE